MSLATPTTASLPTFGAFVWWNFREIAVTPADLRAHLAASGLTGDVPALDATSEVRTLARSWRAGRGNASRFKSEIAHEDDNAITIGILRREQVGAREVGWVQVDRVVWDKSGASWLASGISDEAAAFRGDALRAATLLDHNAVRPIAQAVLDDLRAFRLRDQGGFYFVAYSAPGARETVAALQSLIGGLGRSTLLVAEQNSESARNAVAEEARETLGASLATMREQIAEWKSKARNARKDAVGNLLAEFADLRERADLYADALRVRLDDLLAEIESVRDEARSLVRDEDEKRPADGLVASLLALVDGYEPIETGEIVIALADLVGTALPEAAHSADRAARYWTSNTAGRRALAAIGFEARVEDDLLVLRPAVAEQAEQAVEVA
jgi:hypothetical protein